MFGCCCSSNGRKSTIFAALLTAGATIIAAAVFASSDNEPATPAEGEIAPANFQPEAEMTPEQMMAGMAEWGALAPEHEVLESLVGTWDCTTEFTMGPGEPTRGEGTNNAALVLGGRWVTQHFVMPDFMGSTYEGMGAFGFDKAKGKYVSVWLDSMSTGMSTMEGTWDEDSSTMTWTGTAVYPGGPDGAVMEVPVKHVVKRLSDDKHVMEFWEPTGPDGELSRTGKIVYTRSK
jgi:hypothetical protein